MNILVVEDERRMADILAQGLAEDGHRVTVACDGAEGFSLAGSHSFDLIVLDLMLPRIGGIEVARRLRAERNQTPILILTARDSNRDVVEGLDCGADDYLTKPFSFDVFLARVRALSRRHGVRPAEYYQIGDLSLDASTREVRKGKRIIDLTAREYSLLELMMKRSPRVLSRDAILEAVWGLGSDVSENSLEVIISRLRSKLDDGETRLIHTIRGVGYCMKASAAS